MISIIILTHDEHDLLASHLPTLLSQQEVDYEVIVVDMHSEDDTTDLLVSMEEEHAHLRHLSLPTNAKDISHEMLALHLGMRAAISSRVLLLQADTQLPSSHWLYDVQEMWNSQFDILLLPTTRNRAKGWWKDYFTRGHEAWQNHLHILQATRYHLYRAGNAIVGLNKGTFLRHNASASQLALKTGIMDIFIAHKANRHNTVLILLPTLFPIRDAQPSGHHWSQKRLFDTETYHHLPSRKKRLASYVQHFFCTLHRGAIPYSIMDAYDKVRWCFTSKKTFIKKHY